MTLRIDGHDIADIPPDEAVRNLLDCLVDMSLRAIIGLAQCDRIMQSNECMDARTLDDTFEKAIQFWDLTQAQLDFTMVCKQKPDDEYYKGYWMPHFKDDDED